MFMNRAGTTLEGTLIVSYRPKWKVICREPASYNSETRLTCSVDLKRIWSKLLSNLSQLQPFSEVFIAVSGLCGRAVRTVAQRSNTNPASKRGVDRFHGSEDGTRGGKLMLEL